MSIGVDSKIHEKTEAQWKQQKITEASNFSLFIITPGC